MRKPSRWPSRGDWATCRLTWRQRRQGLGRRHMAVADCPFTSGHGVIESSRASFARTSALPMKSAWEVDTVQGFEGLVAQPKLEVGTCWRMEGSIAAQELEEAIDSCQSALERLPCCAACYSDCRDQRTRTRARVRLRAHRMCQPFGK